MNILDSAILVPVTFFFFTLVLGLWLSCSGRPLNFLVFNLHKLVALAAVILTGTTVYKWLRGAQAITIERLMPALLAVCVLVLFVSGAFLSREKPVNKMLLWAHRVMPALAVIIAGVIIYLMIG